ncbi:DUF1428 domain-containing protein [Bordetella hinzii]|uniref:DUF1428 domain-containing protein n=2 Tax=Bordetella hinzii TaxID=103855 RepID=A0AAN1RZR4_9BORD|nr:DUF1428 domain-containing protein [Bordetella hinzii]AKQ55394.1 hypothetical protein ACR54_02079 [Bordetella hinzii]AKQ59895.1 hypothetical protein ACR55_02027 [Bordetella hinzii]AZW18993.1 DUF1428 domain-containing protein [Bordetella hinzii]KCB23087.1 PF07237 family protein [Bordetella hinzii L60]KCB24274.1 PF07237 family protein [Bordetella hinzii OH87 BAL007II]
MKEYVDGYLLAVPSDQLETYRALASRAGEIWKEHGALDYRECVGESLDHDHGMRSFRHAADAGENETVVFSWIVFRDKGERDRINAAVMADPRLQDVCIEGVFDPKRMAWGGFDTLVQA